MRRWRYRLLETPADTRRGLELARRLAAGEVLSVEDLAWLQRPVQVEVVEV